MVYSNCSTLENLDRNMTSFARRDSSSTAPLRFRTLGWPMIGPSSTSGSSRLRLPTVDGFSVLQTAYAAAISEEVGGNLPGLASH